MNIGYTTDLGEPYAKSLKAATTIEQLRSHLTVWEHLAGDAVDSFNSPEFSWQEFEKGREKERRNEFAGEEWCKKYGAILMPEILMRIDIFAQQYQVPDGCVYIRLRDEKMIQVKNGRAVWIESAAPEKK